jgi:hypothetical protein
MSQEAAQQLETVLQDLKAKRDDQQQKLDTAKAVIDSLDADLTKVRAEFLKEVKYSISLSNSNNPAYDAQIAEIRATAQKKLDDAVASLKAAVENGRLNRENLILLNKSITSTEEKISAEQASTGQVAPVATVNPDIPPDVAPKTRSFVNTAAPAAVGGAAAATATATATAATDPVPTEAPAPVQQDTPKNTTPATDPVPTEAPAAIPNAPSFTGISSPTFGEVAPQEIGGGFGALPVRTGFSTQGLLGPTRADAAKAVEVNQATQVDWRVKLTLAPEANAKYLYNVAKAGDILFPLKQTKGVIFPYTPSINVQYVGGYSPAEIVHSNYKIFQYKGSSVDQVTITCDFTAQDTSEANYLLAVIHFFRSVTKMFYGNDQNPNPGVPPPLCYLTGLGQFQFNNHALVVSGFTYDLPTDVDYIRSSAPTTISGTELSAYNSGVGAADIATNRTAVNGVPIGGKPAAPMFNQQSTYLSNSNVTYVPTKMKMTITCLPVVSRNQVSTDFSLREYATGKLLRRGFW